MVQTLKGSTHTHAQHPITLLKSLSGCILCNVVTTLTLASRQIFAAFLSRNFGPLHLFFPLDMAAAAASSSESNGGDGAAIDKEKKIVDELNKISVVVETTTTLLPSQSPGRKLLALYAIIKALRPHTKNSGAVLWRDAKRAAARDNVAPQTREAKIDGKGRATQGIEPKDLTQALRFVIPVDELRVIVKSEPILEALRSLVLKSIDGRINVVVDDMVRTVLGDEQEEQKMVQTLQLPELVLGAGPLECRVCKSFDDNHALGSIHDYLSWLQVDKDGHHSDWDHWLRDELEKSLDEQGPADLRDPSHVVSFVLEHHKFKGIETPMGNIKIFERLTRLCVGKSKIADGIADAALTLYTKNLANDYPELKDFLDPTQHHRGEKHQLYVATSSHPMDLDAFEQTCLENDDVEPEKAARTLAKIALARQYRDSSNQQQLALIKRQKIVDIEKYEAETRASRDAEVEKIRAVKDAEVEKIRAAKDAEVEKIRAAKDAEVEKIQAEVEKTRAEQDKTKMERAKIQAERQRVDDVAQADREERERQRLHTVELATERRRQEIRGAVAEGTIPQAVAEELLGENRKTPIPRFEQWISKVLRCSNASKCSSELSRRFNNSVSSGEHIKPLSHRNAAGNWNFFEEHDGSHLRILHQAIHDARNGVVVVTEKQRRLSFD